MKTKKLLLLPALALFGLVQLSGQTADDIVNNYVNALGGKALLASIKSASYESITEVMGNESPTTTIILNGKGYKNVSDMNGQKMIQCYTDKGGWTINPMNGGSVETMPEEQYNAGKGQIDIGGPLLDYAAKGGKVELVGREMVDSVNTFKIKLTGANSLEINYYFDPASWHILQTLQTMKMMDQSMEMKVKYSDYRKTKVGYTMPFTIDMNFGDQFSLRVIVKKAEFNKDIDPTIFEQGKE